MEDGLDGAVEEGGDAEGEGEAGVVLAGLDGVDRLAADAEFPGEVGLGPAAFGAEFAPSLETARTPCGAPSLSYT